MTPRRDDAPGAHPGDIARAPRQIRSIIRVHGEAEEPAPRRRGQLILLPSCPGHRIFCVYEDASKALALLKVVVDDIAAEVRLDMEECELKRLTPGFVSGLRIAEDLVDRAAWAMEREAG